MQCIQCGSPTAAAGYCPQCAGGLTTDRPTLVETGRKTPGQYCGACGARNSPGWVSCFACSSVDPRNVAPYRTLVGLISLIIALLTFATMCRLLIPTRIVQTPPTVVAPITIEPVYIQPAPIYVEPVPVPVIELPEPQQSIRIEVSGASGTSVYTESSGPDGSSRAVFVTRP